MHAHIAHRFSYGTIEDLFREFFGLSVNDSEIHMFKGLVARRYRKTYEGLLAKLASGSVLHADETEVHLRTGKGYVWVFASIEEVAYVYKPSREGEFIKDLLQDFRGVLVSDFYAVYDAIACPQQKCLIHLMRDLNQALLDSPYDDDVHSLTQPFGTLLREIVTTVDEYGLKHYRLARHQKGVAEFFTQIRARNVRSETAQAVRDRLRRANALRRIVGASRRPKLEVAHRLPRVCADAILVDDQRALEDRLRPAGGEDVRDPRGQNPGLAGSSPGQHQHRAVERLDRLALLGIEVGEIGRACGCACTGGDTAGRWRAQGLNLVGIGQRHLP
jgi:hypothetical protein